MQDPQEELKLLCISRLLEYAGIVAQHQQRSGSSSDWHRTAEHFARWLAKDPTQLEGEEAELHQKIDLAIRFPERSADIVEQAIVAYWDYAKRSEAERQAEEEANRRDQWTCAHCSTTNPGSEGLCVHCGRKWLSRDTVESDPED